MPAAAAAARTRWRGGGGANRRGGRRAAAAAGGAGLARGLQEGDDHAALAEHDLVARLQPGLVDPLAVDQRARASSRGR